MMGTQSSRRQPALFSYHIDLEHRLGADHLLRKVSATLDLSFVIPAVCHCYGRSGNVSLDPQVIIKLLLLLFLYDIPSERELMEQVRARLDFLWFLGFDLDTEIPDHSVLSKARARWGSEVFEQLFVQTVDQCVQAGLHALVDRLDEELLKNLAAPTGPGFGEHAVVGNLRIQIKAQEPEEVQPGADLLHQFTLTGDVVEEEQQQQFVVTP